MLTQQEWKGVLDEMRFRMAEVGNGVGTVVGQWIGLHHSSRISVHTQYDLWADRILRYCERYGWIEDPALLLVLLRKVARAPKTPFGAEMPTIIARIAALAPISFWTGGRAYDTCHLVLKLPFLNRETTRCAFGAFDEPLELRYAARVLVVNGPLGSGKTFTGDFLRLLVGLRSAQHGVAEVNFETWKGKLLTPDALAAYLAKQMGTPEARAEADMTRIRGAINESPERWGKELAIWLAGEASRTEKTWHLLLDNFHLTGVPESTYSFIEQLLAALAGQPLAWQAPIPDGPPAAAGAPRLHAPLAGAE